MSNDTAEILNELEEMLNALAWDDEFSFEVRQFIDRKRAELAEPTGDCV